MILLYIITVILAYLIGSFPTGYILVKAVKGIDIREVGSGSTGATNVKRVLGTKAYIFVMFVDALKGLLPVLAAKYIDAIGYHQTAEKLYRLYHCRLQIVRGSDRLRIQLSSRILVSQMTTNMTYRKLD